MMKKFFCLMTLTAILAPGLPGDQDKTAAAALLGGGPVTQIGIVVKDIERSARVYAEALGVPVPSWELTDPLEKAHTLYLGRPSPARAKLAFIELPNIVIELIEPVGGPSTWRDVLEAKGEGIHHIAFEVKDMDKRLAELKTKGLTLIQSGDYTGGRYSYVDATAKMGIILELLENF
jgi:methylmalonyl-CoA/ethylmalonyl-CoA epimerase